VTETKYDVKEPQAHRAKRGVLVVIPFLLFVLEVAAVYLMAFGVIQYLKPKGPRVYHITGRIGEQVMCDFYTTSRWYVTTIWFTNYRSNPPVWGKVVTNYFDDTTSLPYVAE